MLESTAEAKAKRRPTSKVSRGKLWGTTSPCLRATQQVAAPQGDHTEEKAEFDRRAQTEADRDPADDDHQG